MHDLRNHANIIPICDADSRCYFVIVADTR